jgi:hypothetical protein
MAATKIIISGVRLAEVLAPIFPVMLNGYGRRTMKITTEYTVDIK